MFFSGTLLVGALSTLMLYRNFCQPSPTVLKIGLGPGHDGVCHLAAYPSPEANV